MKEAKGRVELDIEIDGKLQNEILKKYQQKRVAKTKREVAFAVSSRTACRDFEWHLKRLHHWWNCAIPMQEGKEGGKPLEIKVA